MNYLFSFPMHVAQSLNYLLAYGYRFGRMLKENSKIILLFLITIKVLLCSIALICLIDKISFIQLNYVLGGFSFFGLVLFVSFIGLIIAYFYPESYSIDKDITYYINKMIRNTDVEQKSNILELEEISYDTVSFEVYEWNRVKQEEKIIESIELEESYRNNNFPKHFDLENESNISELEEIKNDSIDFDAIVRDKNKWEQMLSKLNEKNILDEDGVFLGFGPNYSELKTQLAVLIYCLHDSKVILINKQKDVVSEFSKLFNIGLTPEYYSQVKGKIGVENEISKYQYIREEIQSYI